MINSILLENIQSLKETEISRERQAVLRLLVDYIQSKVNQKLPIQLNFICTHNSRRSHLSQIWAQTMAHYYQVQQVSCYSGGTEATAMFHQVVTTLKKQGFAIQPISEEIKNTVFAVKYDTNEPALICFSKAFDDAFNPENGFCAVMTCSSADEGCPFIAGAALRLPIRYNDPKAFDNTPQMAEKYEERSLQIAAEMKFVFSKIKSNV
jgi:arsenate reductase